MAEHIPTTLCAPAHLTWETESLTTAVKLLDSFSLFSETLTFSRQNPKKRWEFLESLWLRKRNGCKLSWRAFEHGRPRGPGAQLCMRPHTELPDPSVTCVMGHKNTDHAVNVRNCWVSELAQEKTGHFPQEIHSSCYQSALVGVLRC